MLMQPAANIDPGATAPFQADAGSDRGLMRRERHHSLRGAAESGHQQEERQSSLA